MDLGQRFKDCHLEWGSEDDEFLQAGARIAEEETDLIAKIERLTTMVEEATKANDGLKAEVAVMQTQVKQAGEDRRRQNEELKAIRAGQQEMQRLLEAALNIGRVGSIPGGILPPRKIEPRSKPFRTSGLRERSHDQTRTLGTEHHNLEFLMN